jgi:sugar lactone lactonase YvrE
MPDLVASRERALLDRLYAGRLNRFDPRERRQPGVDAARGDRLVRFVRGWRRAAGAEIWPDGGAIDAEGCYWMAGNDGWEIVRFTPKGEVDRRIALPVAKPSMLAFGGPRLDTIYVTSIRPASVEGQAQAAGLFAVHAGVTGVMEPSFKG